MKAGHCTLIVCALCIMVMLAYPLAHAGSNTAITDDFDLGTWSPFMTRVQKSIPVCIWNPEEPTTTFNITISSDAGNNQLGIRNSIGDVITYRVHWLSGNRFRRPERLTAGLPSRRSYTSTDTVRCGDGPTGMLRITLDPAQLNDAPAGIYTDTLRLMISPL